MGQIPLFEDLIIEPADVAHDTFSHNHVCPDDARISIEDRYRPIFEETDRFSRKLVSFQANKTNVLHSWIKYREGFSAELVALLLNEIGCLPGDTILDPFAGSCTTLLVAGMCGIDAVGIELLPHCHLAWAAKSRVFEYDLSELQDLKQWLSRQTPPPTDRSFPHVLITESAFPVETERDLMAYRVWEENLPFSEPTKTLYRFVLMSILEEVSYTRKDGQYLRWDGRAEKIREQNARRVAQGKEPIEGIFKGDLPAVRDALLRAVSRVISDIKRLQSEPPVAGRQHLMTGSALYTLPELVDGRFAGVITSPPYANRYDYTRTYALELAYLQTGDAIFKFRQEQLSCTVENKSKNDQLEAYYRSMGRLERYITVRDTVRGNIMLREINEALEIRNHQGEINNQGVLGMINQYFTELAFVYAELFRVCRRGAKVAFVNDNVRYAGEIIPVDTLSTNLAEQIGFEPVKIYVLPQRKGNSSQQMGRFGRAALRKSITIWRKP